METKLERGHSEVHLLPCNIHYDGPAPVESYFHPKESSPKGEFTANFRGRKLVGEVVELPANTEGAILEVLNKESVSIHTSFHQIHIWDHDLKPDARLLQESFDWFEIADAVSRSDDFFDVLSTLLDPFVVVNCLCSSDDIVHNR
jgi:hypothetical protein